MSKVFYKTVMTVLLAVSIFPFLYYSNIETQKVTQLQKVNYQQKLEVNGVIQSAEQMEMSLSYPIYIKDCYVKENDYVNKGQLLFTLDTEKMQNTVKNYDFTDVADGDFSVDKAALLDISEEIYASESGFVREIAAQSGSIVMAEENLCIIENSDELKLKITIGQEDYSNIYVGDKIIFSPVIAPSKTYSGTISDKTAIIRKETSLTGTKTVIDIFADIDYADDYISQGLQFSGTIIKSADKPIYTLPYEFINQDENGEYVNIYDNGIVTKEYIETGIETETSAEVITAFAADTLFVKDNYKKGKLLLEYGQ